MATSQRTRILFMLFAFMCFTLGGQCLSLRGRIAGSSTLQEEREALEIPEHRRDRRDPETGQEHCALLTAPWTEVNVPSSNWGHLYRLKILPVSKEVRRRPVFPGQPLFRFVRRVYRCCQQDFQCGSVKGIQGLDLGGSSTEFLLSEDVLSATIARAEIHLHISNPENLNIQPLLPSLEKRQLPTRFRSWTKDGVVELRVDLMLLFQALQRLLGRRSGGSRLLSLRRAGGLGRPWTSDPQDNPAALQDTAPTAWGEGDVDEQGERPLQAALELGLALYCSTPHTSTHPCESHGVQLLHTPFITLSYR